jgi:hypothetical protein
MVRVLAHGAALGGSARTATHAILSFTMHFLEADFSDSNTLFTNPLIL